MTLFIEKYLVVSLVLFARYFIFCGLFFSVMWKGLKDRLQNFEVNSTELFSRQIQFELKYSVQTLFIFAVAGVAFAWAKLNGWGLIYYNVSDYGWLYFFFSIGLMLLINDIYFYWTHRLLHKKWFFSNTHFIHHRSKKTTPFTSHSFHWGESIVNMFIVFFYPYIFPVHPVAYVIFTFVAFFNNLYGHGGYDLVPAHLRNTSPFRYLNSPTVHGWHHSKLDGNFGLYTNIWDRIHGTFRNPND